MGIFKNLYTQNFGLVGEKKEKKKTLGEGRDGINAIKGIKYPRLAASLLPSSRCDLPTSSSSLLEPPLSLPLSLSLAWMTMTTTTRWVSEWGAAKVPLNILFVLLNILLYCACLTYMRV